MAKLGMADAEVAAGKFDGAIAVYKELSADKDGPLPVDGILMQLGRAYDAAGQARRRAPDVQAHRRRVPAVALLGGSQAGDGSDQGLAGFAKR